MTKLQAAKIEELKGSFRGEILFPSEDAYESARKIWNATIDKHPALIVRCATTSDVVCAGTTCRPPASCSRPSRAGSKSASPE